MDKNLFIYNLLILPLVQIFQPTVLYKNINLFVHLFPHKIQRILVEFYIVDQPKILNKYEVEKNPSLEE